MNSVSFSQGSIVDFLLLLFGNFAENWQAQAVIFLFFFVGLFAFATESNGFLDSALLFSVMIDSDRRCVTSTKCGNNISGLQLISGNIRSDFFVTTDHRFLFKGVRYFWVNNACNFLFSDLCWSAQLSECNTSPLSKLRILFWSNPKSTNFCIGFFTFTLCVGENWRSRKWFHLCQTMSGQNHPKCGTRPS